MLMIYMHYHQSTYFEIKTTKNNWEGEFSGKSYIYNCEMHTLWWITEHESSSI